jgi:hypothetical protein
VLELIFYSSAHFVFFLLNSSYSIIVSFLNQKKQNQIALCTILDAHSSGYEERYLLGYNAP